MTGFLKFNRLHVCWGLAFLFWDLGRLELRHSVFDQCVRKLCLAATTRTGLLDSNIVPWVFRKPKPGESLDPKPQTNTLNRIYIRSCGVAHAIALGDQVAVLGGSGLGSLVAYV